MRHSTLKPNRYNTFKPVSQNGAFYELSKEAKEATSYEVSKELDDAVAAWYQKVRKSLNHMSEILEDMRVTPSPVNPDGAIKNLFQRIADVFRRKSWHI